MVTKVKGGVLDESALSGKNMTGDIAFDTTTLKIDSSNNRVGIGTASPDSPLEIDGGSSVNTVLHLTSTAANTYLKISDSNTNEGNFIGCTTNDLTFFTRNTERFRVDSTGNLLLGATSSNAGGFGSVSPQLLVAGTMPQVALHETDTDKDGYIGISGSTMFIQTADAIPIRFGTSDAEKMRIDSSGNVLVGTTTFNNLSTESGVLASNNVVMARGSLADHQDACAVLQYSSDTTWLRAYGDTAGSGLMVFRTGGGAGSTDTEAMRINSSGRVMIGSTSLLQSDNMLSITGSGSGAGNAMMDIRNTSSSDTCGCIALSKGTTTTSSANRYIWFFANNFSTSMGAIGGNGASNVQFVTASDERLKENIKPITGALDKVLALNPVSFDWKQNGEHIKAGFIAQEVEKVLPEYTATEEDEMKTKSLTGGMTAGYISVLTKAVQEQQEQIETLKAEIKELKENK